MQPWPWTWLGASATLAEAVKLIAEGRYVEVGPPRPGKQHLGHAPGGAQDRFSFESARILLGGSDDIRVLEMVMAPVVEIESDVWMVVTGAHHASIELDGRRHSVKLQHGQVFLARRGERLSFGWRTLGFRSYLAWRPAEGIALGQRTRGEVDHLHHWSAGPIRVLEGPEFQEMHFPHDVFRDHWLTSTDMNDMGMRLERRGVPIHLKGNEMISSPVADGTVQMTPKGPIVLLRQRQTIGGYPRVLGVISSDIDRLAQFAPHQVLRFELVSTDQARSALAETKVALDELRCCFESVD